MNASTRLAFGLLAAGFVAGCGQRGQPSTEGTGSSRGSVGVYFVVSVSRPTGGTVTSQDGQIVCGTAGAACTGRFGWSTQAVLAATPDPGYTFGTWAGDCQYSGACVLDTRVTGADKFVVAVFGLGGDAPHGNFTSPAIHGPAFLDRLAGLPGTFDCSSSSCHGPSYGGQGPALSCNSCHAAAGWVSWRTNCTFCHGARVKSGYAFAADPARAAPPDAVGQRLTGAPAPARTGAHQQHLAGSTAAGEAYSAPFRCATCHAIPADLSHVGGSTARASVVLSGAGQASLPASLGTYESASGTCTTYCHGDGKVAGASPAFASAGIACDGCHGVPPSDAHPYRGSDVTECAGCHPDTMRSDGTLLAAGGRHVDGAIQHASCDACHGFPPATGAHVAHFGLTGPDTSRYGDTRALADMFPAESPTGAPGVYAFGCGSCHPLHGSNHMNGVADVVLHEADAPAGSLKALAAADAAYDVTARTCSGVYCHSSGQATPAFRPTPAWTSGATLACDGCHENPPRYPSGGAGSATANSHVNLADDGYEFGHFLGLLGPYHTSKHGGGWGPGEDAAPITCQTCHADTTDPSSTGPSGFYYLDTTGDYVLPGGDPYRHASGWSDGLRCTTCHSSASATAPERAGSVLPLRHVNGVRDVVFDARETLPPLAWLPASPRTPVQPYWFTGASPSLWSGVPASWSSDTVSFSLSRSVYDRTTKTCTSVACHIGESPRWGRPYEYVTNGGASCFVCHPL